MVALGFDVIGSAAMRTSTVVLGVLCLVGCNSDYPAPKSQLPTAPAANDPAFTISDIRNWYLIADAATPGNDALSVMVIPPTGTKFIDAYVADLPPVRMDEYTDAFRVKVDIKTLAAGAHDVLLTADGSDTAFAKLTFNRSAAYYVLVSTDYDFSDPGTYAIGYMDWLHRDHKGMRITHFWAPYTYTDPVVTDVRRGELDTWIKKQRDTFHDEIGLHIHPYCNFVVDAGLTCITNRSTVYTTGDMSGYTINLSAYGRTDFSTLLQHAFTLFSQHGLGKPTTFRAGGWTADLNTLLALNDNGFIADTSALNWARIEEWKGAELYNWNMSHWAPINDTSQPYWPSQTDVLSSAAPDMGLLEIPDNGVMIDYVSVAEMNGIFDANWDGSPFATPRTLMMGFHPATGFTDAEYRRVDELLKHADAHLAATGLGPVVYITLSDVTPAFAPQ
ncbi:MAG: hypothetical protein JWO36_5693 [Myxococcales bacterium]|nr:hypothetical protein [Myxococcales bacterium]